MKKTLTLFFLIFTTLILALNFNVSDTHASANNDFELNKDLIEQEAIFQEIIKNVPSGTFSETQNPISTHSLSNYSPKAGDILYTPSTQCVGNANICKGITGHVGIVTSSTGSVIHIAGAHQTPQRISMTSWFTRYAKTVVVRPNNTTQSLNSAIWAENYYGPGKPGSTKTYAVTVNSDLATTLSLNTTYCSLLVWQAYYFGGGRRLSLGIPVVPVAFVNFASQHNMTVHMKIGY